jgi:peptide/nickel transport system substrate-binding protein
MNTWMLPFLQRFGLIALVAGGLCLYGFSKFQTPHATAVSTEALNPISTYQPSKPYFYKNVTLDGVELIESPYPIGQFGGTLFQAALGEGPKTLNPWASFDGTSSAISSMLTCQAVQSNNYTGQIMPWVAKSYSILPDKKHIRLTFRKGLKWSDGHPLTVDDLLFTWNVIIQKGLGNPSTRDILLVDGDFPTMRKIDTWTVEVATKRPYSPLLLNLGQAIAPKHIFEPILKKGGEDAFGAAWSTQEAEQHPERFVSCGPWVLDKYQSKERIIFKRNPHYFVVNQKAERLPYLEREVITFAKDMSYIQLLFEQGALHTHSGTPQNLGRLQRLKSPKFKLIDLGPADGTTFMAFNLNTRKDPNGVPIVDAKLLHWFQNRGFRQALNVAVNRPQMVENVLKGLGTPLLTSMGLNSIYLNKSVEEQAPYDLKKAEQLLKASGFRLNAKHELYDDRGNRVAFTVVTNSGNSDRESALVQLQHDYNALGIKLSLQPVEFNTLVDRMKTGRWEAMVMGLSGGSNLEPHQGANVFKSNAALHLFNQRPMESLSAKANDLYPFEARLDRLYDLGTTEFDFAKRKPYYDEIQSILYEESPMVYLFTGKVLVAVRSELQNVDVTPLGGALHNIESIWIKQFS